MPGLFLFLDMQTFLDDVLDEIGREHESLEDIIFVLPSKRAGIFLRNSMARNATRTFFVPEIYSIEDFVETISGLRYATNTQQLFALYDAYLKTGDGQKDDFYSFATWGQTLLQDFNEIDRYLVSREDLFSYLSAIQELNHWYVQPGKTQMMEEYARFWNGLNALYQEFTLGLMSQQIGHQGLLYREACNRLKSYLKKKGAKSYIFIGFNALNKAEEYIIQEILKKHQSDIYWDLDPLFIDDPIHDAGHFIRHHKSHWDYFKNHTLKGLKTTYSKTKDIQIVGLPKNVSQAKYVGELLKKLAGDDQYSLQNTAVILGDETLLNPIINSIPEEISRVNITMGYPLAKTPPADLFFLFLDLHTNRGNHGWYSQHILAILAHPYMQLLLMEAKQNTAVKLMEAIKDNNVTYLSHKDLNELHNSKEINLPLLFNDQLTNPVEIIGACLNLISNLKSEFQNSKDALALEYLYRFYTLFNQLKDITSRHTFIKDIKSLQYLFRELLSIETLDFQGEPLEGLQVMGMLESRNLDFETVLITSVNEGILPSGKSNNSFIPFDLKKEFGLPTYKEKDAVYTYHFYRLLQRAKKIYILYNTEPDVLLGGERSRLITQLLTDEQVENSITHYVASPHIQSTPTTLEIIEKDEAIIKHIHALANRGFSPTSLTNYIKNPIDFYKKNILHLEDVQQIEENIAANTFGTIVHDSLEELYKPLIGTVLSEESLRNLLPRIHSVVIQHFGNNNLKNEIKRGKNYIAFQVIERYLQNFIKLEIEEVKKHTIEIIALEKKLTIPLNIPGLDFPVMLRGKLDRVDKVDGIVRIIDFKTGAMKASDTEIVAMEQLITQPEKSKAFQLLCYALLYGKNHAVLPLEAGMISFRNLKNSPMLFATKESARSTKKDTVIDIAGLSSFSAELHSLIAEICNPKIPFIERKE